MDSPNERTIKTPPPLPPPLPPAINDDRPEKRKAVQWKRSPELTDKQKASRRIIRNILGGTVLVIAAGIVIFKIVSSSPGAAAPKQSTQNASPATTDSTISSNKNAAAEQVTTESERYWQAVLSPQFKPYKEEDDIPSQVERYKDDLGHRLVTEAWGRNIFSEDADSAIAEALNLVFQGRHNVVKTKDTLFVGTGVRKFSNQEEECYYIVYNAQSMQSYSLYGKQGDALFSIYSKKMLGAVRELKTFH